MQRTDWITLADERLPWLLRFLGASWVAWFIAGPWSVPLLWLTDSGVHHRSSQAEATHRALRYGEYARTERIKLYLTNAMTPGDMSGEGVWRVFKTERSDVVDEKKIFSREGTDM